MPWPGPVIRQFTMVPPNSSEAEFHGPYNKLLYSLFPADSLFMVVAHYIPTPQESVDCFEFEVMLEDKPVLVVELRSPGDLRYASMREAADDQIRDRIRDLSDDCPLPVLHAVSAMGTKLCFFTKRRGQPIQPPVIPRDPEHETDTAPQERWDHDLLEEEGEQIFRAMVEEIKQGCAAL